MVSALILPALLLALQQRVLVSGQSPGDFVPTCRTGLNRNNHIFAADWRILLDSYDYANLYNPQLTPSPVWISRSFDSDSGGTGNWNQVVGGVCTWSLRTCSFSSPSQDNWLFTQFVSYSTAVEVLFNVTYSFSECQQSSCNPYITVYKYDTDGIVDDAARSDRGNYLPLFGTEQESRLEDAERMGRPIDRTLRFNRPSGRGGFYLAFRDQGTCGMVTRVIVYYRVIDGFTDASVSCPEVPLPVQGSGEPSTLSCSCVLSDSSGVESLSRTCGENRVCTEGQRCACDPGFEFNATANTCTICPLQTYKAGISNGSCQSCPSLSFAVTPGSTVCECISPAIRAEGAGPEEECRLSVPGGVSSAAAVATTFFLTLLVAFGVGFPLGLLVMYLCIKRGS